MVPDWLKQNWKIKSGNAVVNPFETDLKNMEQSGRVGATKGNQFN
jgi:hypothetical protein